MRHLPPTPQRTPLLPRRSNQSPTEKKNRIHKKQAQLERDYYNQNTKLAKEQKEIAHYSYDWSQTVRVPHFSQQPSQDYYLSSYKVNLFGVQNEVNREQTNYILGEHELLNKGSNGTLSLVFNSIKQLNRGEKHLKLTCDNAVGQNKNNIAL
jgi:hypothetical protein